MPPSQAATRSAPKRGRRATHEAGDDLDDADDVHGVVGAAGQDVVDPRRQVDAPVDHHVGELVEAEEDRGDGEADAQQREGLVGRVGAQLGRGGAGGRGRCADGGGGHVGLLLVDRFGQLASGGPVGLRLIVAGVSSDQRDEALVVLLAGRAALEVGAHAGHGRVGVRAGQRELDVAVELLEALLAGQLGSGGAEESRRSVWSSWLMVRSRGRRGRGRGRVRPGTSAAGGARRAGSCRARRASCAGARPARRSARRRA